MSKRRRFPRFLRWLAGGCLLALLAAGGATWWAHRHLGRLMVASFNRTFPSLELTAKTVVLTDFETLDLKAVRVRVRAGGAEVLQIPVAKMRFSWREMRGHFIREIVIENPRFRLTDSLLAALPPAGGGRDETPWSVGHLAIKGGRGEVAMATLPEVRLKFAVELSAGAGPNEIGLSGLSVRTRGDGLEVLAIPSVKIRASAEDLRQQRIREMLIAAPRLAITDAVLALWPAETERSSAAPAWILEKLTLTGGRASVDLAGAPRVDFGFAARLGAEVLPPRERDELQAAVEFTDLAFRSRGAAFEPFLRVPAVRAKFRLPEVQREHRIAWVEVERFDFRFNKIFRDFIASGAKPALPAAPPPASIKDSRPLGIGELRVIDGAIHLDDLGLGIPSIDCRVNTAFRNLALAPDAGAGGQELQTIELSRLALTSPLDPFVPVLSLDTIFLRFTLAGLWRREIEEVAIVRPRLDIGPDLFWYIDRVQKNAGASDAAAAPAAEAGPDWLVKKFDATSGQLFLALEGHSELALPMPFESHAENLNFQKLSDLRLKLVIEMPEQNYDFPGYELALRGVGGRVEFSLPPARGANNVVNTLRLRAVRWKQFAGRDCFLDVTYDERGIYGNLGGKSYGGVLRGQFNFLLAAGAPWNGWVSGTGVALGPLTDALAPQKFSLTGPANFRLTVTARGPEIEQLAGDFSATRPGRMRVGKIDDIIKDLPGDWSGMKRGLSRIGLEALRAFPYETAHGDFLFHGRAGALHLDLRGADGARKIDVEVHDAPAPRERVAARQP